MKGQLLSSKHQDHATPPELFAPIHATFQLTLDVCATAENAKLPRYWTPEDDALAKSWAGERYWMNPPYSALPVWMAKARGEVIAGSRLKQPTLGVHLLPMRPDSWWHKYVTAPAGRLEGSWYCPESEVFWLAWSGLTVGIHHIRGRVPFLREGNTTGAPFPSVLVIFATPGPRPRARARPPWRGGAGLAPLDWAMP